MAANTNPILPILVKINKLLALSEGKGTTEAEASLAAEHVQRLLQDHGLTLAQVEADRGSSDEVARREKTTTSHKAMYVYQRMLMNTIAENNFCLHVIKPVFVPSERRANFIERHPETGEIVRGYRSPRHILVGRELNVAVTIQTYEYLIEALSRACPYDHRGTDGKRFLEGGASRIAERLSERRRQREKESGRSSTNAGNGTHRELVLSDVYGSEANLNNDALNNFPAGTTATRRRERLAKEAAQQIEHDRLVAEGMGDTEAWYRAYGYGAERSAELAASYDKRSRRGRGGRGRTRNWTQDERGHYEKVNSQAYKAGRSAGDRIGLDDQVAATRRRAITKGGG